MGVGVGVGVGVGAGFADGLQAHADWRPWLYIHAAASAFTTGSQIESPALPCGVSAKVAGMNWNRPEAPLALWALGL